ncbi:hypothetical protein XENOCAPTIV_008228 [Xenoophorus captivus]|uniref:Uncharacterized protein n=1 Tax=Xenoophorus captivus TaxID=1517983 RepID=A0ABV0RYN7_9TELE
MAGTFQGNCLCGVLGAGMFMAGCAFLLIAAFPVGQIALGAVYIHECPVGPVIPVYMIVFGILALLMMVMFTLLKFLSPAAQSHNIWIMCIIILLFLFFACLLFGSYHIYSIYPPNYNKNTTGSNSSTRKIYAVTSPNSLTSENQSLQSSNHSQIFWGMIQTGALKNMSRRTNRDLKNSQQLHEVVAVLPYCNRTMYLFAFWTTTLVHVLVGNTLLLIICLYGFMKCMDVFVRHLTA